MRAHNFSRKQSNSVACANCGQSFERAYRISKTRAAKPQFCSAECLSAKARQQAQERLIERFWSKVEFGAADECWEWKGRRLNREGKEYGLFDFGGHPQIASRISYWLATGVHPGALDVCHECDNPPCVNPAHLWLGTAKDNSQDAVDKGRLKGALVPLRGAQVASSKLNEDQVRALRVDPRSNDVLGNEYGVSSNAIRLIKLRRNWGWLDA